MTSWVDGCIHGRNPTFDCHASVNVLRCSAGMLSITACTVDATSVVYASPLFTTFIGSECAVNTTTT
jgi:hypothetical protein